MRLLGGRDWAPWTPRMLALSVAAMAVGVVLVVVAWIGASRESALAKQVVWVNTGVVGCAIAAAAQASWLLQGRRAVGVLRQQVLPDRQSGRRAAAPAVARASAAFVALTGSERYHRVECLLVGGKDAVTIDRFDGLRPCEVCRP